MRDDIASVIRLNAISIQTLVSISRPGLFGLAPLSYCTLHRLSLPSYTYPALHPPGCNRSFVMRKSDLVGSSISLSLERLAITSLRLVFVNNPPSYYISCPLEPRSVGGECSPTDRTLLATFQMDSLRKSVRVWTFSGHSQRLPVKSPQPANLPG